MTLRANRVAALTIRLDPVIASTLSDLARELGVSRSRLMRQILRDGVMRTQRAIERERLEHAPAKLRAVGEEGAFELELARYGEVVNGTLIQEGAFEEGAEVPVQVELDGIPQTIGRGRITVRGNVVLVCGLFAETDAGRRAWEISRQVAEARG